MNIVEQLIATIAPHECLSCSSEGSLLCSDCYHTVAPYTSNCYRCKSASNRGICEQCVQYSPLDAVVCRTPLSHGAKELLHGLKFERQQAAAAPIGDMMAPLLRSLPLDVSIVPIPTASQRIRVRGYDQAESIARVLATKINRPLLPCLVRLGQSRQVGQGRATRALQMQGAFRVARDSQVGGATLLLVDDVLTTGSTIEAAAQTLRDAGAAHVYAATFAAA